MQERTTDHTARKANGKTLRICPKCGQVARFEVQRFRDRKNSTPEKKVYVTHNLYVHRETVMNLCGILVNSIDKHCWENA